MYSVHFPPSTPLNPSPSRAPHRTSAEWIARARGCRPPPRESCSGSDGDVRARWLSGKRWMATGWCGGRDVKNHLFGHEKYRHARRTRRLDATAAEGYVARTHTVVRIPTASWRHGRLYHWAQAWRPRCRRRRPLGRPMERGSIMYYTMRSTAERGRGDPTAATTAADDRPSPSSSSTPPPAAVARVASRRRESRAAIRPCM